MASAKEAVKPYEKNNIKGTLFFCNFWILKEVREWAGITTIFWHFRTAGGQHAEIDFDGVLFDHLTLESEQKAQISTMLISDDFTDFADLKWEVPDASSDLDSYGD